MAKVEKLCQFLWCSFSQLQIGEFRCFLYGPFMFILQQMVPTGHKLCRRAKMMSIRAGNTVLSLGNFYFPSAYHKDHKYHKDNHHFISMMIIILIWWYIIVSAIIIKPHRPFLIFDDICEVHRKVGESSRGWKIEFRLNQQWIENYGNSLGTKTQCKNCESCLFPSYCQTGSNVCPFCPVYRVAQIVGSWDPHTEKVVL